MAATGFTPISLYYTTTASAAPTAGNLVAGELAINTTDGKLFYKDTAGTVQTIATKGGVNGTSSGQVLFNNAGVVGGSNNLFWDISNGRLGIGTTSATQKLEVNGGAAQFNGGGIDATFGDAILFGNSSFPTVQKNRIRSSISATANNNLLSLEAGNGTTGSYNTNQLVLNGDGNVGIGTSSPASKLNVVGTGDQIKVGNGTSTSFLGASGSSGYTGTLTNDPFLFYTNSSERMRIDSSGNVLIGSSTNSFSAKVYSLQSTATEANNLALYTTGGSHNTCRIGLYNDANSCSIQSISNVLSFSSNGVGSTNEKMRLDGSGNLLVGTTSSIGKLVVNNTGTGDTIYSYTTNGSNFSASYAVYRASTNGFSMYFNVNANEAGKIVHPTQTSTNYATTSDYRLKENIKPIQNALQTVLLLNPVSFTWKSDKIDDIGFIAHELQKVCPLAVSGNKDEIKKDGTPAYQAVDNSRLVATLTAAIQEQQTLINNLTTRLNALEGK